MPRLARSPGKAVESPGDFGDDCEIRRSRQERGAHEASPVDEEPDSVGRFERDPIRRRSRNRERRHAEFLLACNMKRRAACGEDADPGGVGEQSIDGSRSALDLLEVVKDQQDLALVQPITKHLCG